jgi:hypothetical protein
LVVANNCHTIAGRAITIAKQRIGAGALAYSKTKFLPERGSAEEKALLQRYTRQLDEQETQLKTLRKKI